MSSQEQGLGYYDDTPAVPAEGNLCGNFPARYVLVLLAFIAVAINTGLRSNINMLIISMVNHSAVESGTIHIPSITGFECTKRNETKMARKDGPFIWSPKIQGVILSSYYWSYMVGQIPGGRFAERYSAKWAVFIAIFVHVINTFLIPVAAKLHYTVLIFIRIIQGFCGASLFPAMHVLLGRWAPPPERAFISSLTYTGMAFGHIVSLFFTGYYANTIGWELICYLMAVGCTPWCILWGWLVRDTPSQQRYITEREREYLMTRLGWRYKHSGRVPWKSVFTSAPFWAILVAHVLSNWTLYLYLIDFPAFVTGVLGYSLEETAIIMSCPLLLHWIFSIFLGRFMDWLRQNRNVSTTVIRKISTSICSVVPAMCFFIIGVVGCARVLILSLLTLGLMCTGASLSGYFCNHIDIAHHYAGTLMSLTNTVATLSAITVPIVVGYLITSFSPSTAWAIIYYLTIVLLLIEFFTYVIFASGEEQSWNNIQEE